jgi:hypothetical protein
MGDEETTCAVGYPLDNTKEKKGSLHYGLRVPLLPLPPICSLSSGCRAMRFKQHGQIPYCLYLHGDCGV